jgi:hypothetical protein
MLAVKTFITPANTGAAAPRALQISHGQARQGASICNAFFAPSIPSLIDPSANVVKRAGGTTFYNAVALTGCV